MVINMKSPVSLNAAFAAIINRHSNNYDLNGQAITNAVANPSESIDG
jgi:hypothetical protein